MELDFANSSKNFERLKKIMDFDFLYLHPLNSNYVLLDDMDKKVQKHYLKQHCKLKRQLLKIRET